MLDVQMQLVRLDAERGIKSIPKLVETEKKELVEVWGTMRRILAARGAPDAEGERRYARVEKLFDRGFPAERGQHLIDAPKASVSSRHEKYERLIAAAQKGPPIKVAVAHPCDEVSLRGALEAKRLGLIEPILVGPVERIRSVAKASGLELDGVELVNTEHSHASAARAVELVAGGRADALMKGSLHTDEIMGAAVSKEGGIRTAKRFSHCFIMDVPGHPIRSLSPTRR